MTCIVALKYKGRIFMGSDSAGSDGWQIVTLANPKIYVTGEFMLGFTTSFRMGQLLGHSLNVRQRENDEPVDRFMVTTFVDGVRACLKAGGWAARNNEREEGGTFLVGYQSRIFRVDSDYQVSESSHDFDAVGCGAQIALGSLFSTGENEGLPHWRITTALGAAECFSNGVRGPFFIKESAALP